jgi:hypothetical protein
MNLKAILCVLIVVGLVMPIAAISNSVMSSNNQIMQNEEIERKAMSDDIGTRQNRNGIDHEIHNYFHGPFKE